MIKCIGISTKSTFFSLLPLVTSACNSLRSKQIESACFSGTAAFMEVRIQSVVVEFILNHVDVLFSAKLSSLIREGGGTHTHTCMQVSEDSCTLLLFLQMFSISRSQFFVTTQISADFITFHQTPDPGGGSGENPGTDKLSGH